MDGDQNKIVDGILMSKLPEPEIQKVQGSIYQMIRKQHLDILAKRDDWIFLKNALTGHILMASEVMEKVDRMVVVLKSLGMRQGDVNHIVVGNHNYHHLLVLAVWHLGGIASLGDTEIGKTGIIEQLIECNATFVTCVKETSSAVQNAAKEAESATGKSIKLLAFDTIAGCHGLMVESTDPKDAPDPYKIDLAEESAIIFWSSGTTGKPKGIVHSHQSLWNALTCPNWKNNFEPLVFCANFFFTYGCCIVFVGLIGGRPTYHLAGSGVCLEDLLTTVKEVKPTTIVVYSPHYMELSECNLENRGFATSDFKSVKTIFQTGAATPEICQHNIKRVFPGLKLINVYGQTEVGVISEGLTTSHLGNIRPGYKVKIVDPDTGTRCKEGEIGEIRVKGQSSMIGYLNMPRSAYFDEDGFGKTGDLGYYDSNGRLYYIERIKERIMYCCNHIYPSELEAVMQTHPDVLQSMAFGIKDEKVIELPSAMVVLKPGSQLTPEKLREFVNARVNADYKKLRGKVLIRQNLPRTSTGKLLRKAVNIHE